MSEPKLTKQEKIAAMLNEKLKGDFVQVASKTIDPKIVKRPTGIATLDIALGGGFPSSTVNVISGQEGVGKDALLNAVIRMHQWLYGEDSSVFIGHTESGYDKLWARKHGVKISLSEQEMDAYEKAHGVKFSSEYRKRLTEQVGTFYISTHNDSEKMFQTILDMLEIGACRLYIINSISNLVPDEFINEEAEDKITGRTGLRSANVVTEFLKKFCYAARPVAGTKVYPTLLITQQARANIQVAKGWGSRDWTTRHGARSLLHFKVIDVMLQTIQRIPKSGGEQVGKVIKWTIDKGKFGTHDGIQGQYNLYFNSGVDYADAMIDAMGDLGRLKINKKTFDIVSPDGEVVVQGSREEIAEKIRADRNMFFQMYDWIRRASKVPFLWKEP